MWAKILAFLVCGAVALTMFVFGTCALFFRR
jgi:hypothetical protein